LRLYMSRILGLAMLIAAVGFASDGFPINPRQNAFIGLITMSIPALCLAVWAKPGRIPRMSLSRRLAHFVIPAFLSVGIIGFGIYLFSLVQTDSESYARTMLTYFTIICGILLLIFVEPPTHWWVGGDEFSGDWRPTLLAIGLLMFFGVCLIVPPLRDFYGLTLLREVNHYVVIVLGVLYGEPGWSSVI